MYCDWRWTRAAARALEAQLNRVKESEAEAQQALSDERARSARLKDEKAQLKARLKELGHQRNSQDLLQAPARPPASASTLLPSMQRPRSGSAAGLGRKQAHSLRHVDHIEPLDGGLQQTSTQFTAQGLEELDAGAAARRGGSLKRSRGPEAALAYETPNGKLGSTTSRRHMPSRGFHVDQVGGTVADQGTPHARSSRGAAPSASASPRRLSRFFPAPGLTRSGGPPTSPAQVCDGETIRPRVGNVLTPQRRAPPARPAAQAAYADDALARDNPLVLPIARGRGTPAASEGSDPGGLLFDFSGAGADGRQNPFQPRR